LQDGESSIPALDCLLTGDNAMLDVGSHIADGGPLATEACSTPGCCRSGRLLQRTRKK
jgi:hypothetical protein